MTIGARSASGRAPRQKGDQVRQRWPGVVVAALACALGVTLMAWGGLGLLDDAKTRTSFEELATATVVETSAAEKDGGRDWEALLAAQPETCAWLTVAQTTIDVPVMRAPADDPDRWLYRGLDGTYSDVGVPYLDFRCSTDGSVMVVYGHRTLYESYLFHDLSDVFEQGAFDDVGAATWETPSGTAATFRPLCAASVHMSDARWQRFSFESPTEMRDWLTWCVDEASAKAADADTLAEGAARCLVLVTCNGRPLYPETRTVTVFVAGGAR